MKSKPNPTAESPPVNRTSQGLRDILFDEIDELRSGKGDPTKSMAVANLAKQIVNTAKVELDFHRQMAQHAAEGTPVKMGSLELGTTAVSAAKSATAA